MRPPSLQIQDFASAQGVSYNFTDGIADVPDRMALDSYAAIDPLNNMFPDANRRRLGVLELQGPPRLCDPQILEKVPVNGQRLSVDILENVVPLSISDKAYRNQSRRAPVHGTVFQSIRDTVYEARAKGRTPVIISDIDGVVCDASEKVNLLIQWFAAKLVELSQRQKYTLNARLDADVLKKMLLDAGQTERGWRGKYGITDIEFGYMSTELEQGAPEILELAQDYAAQERDPFFCYWDIDHFFRHNGLDAKFPHLYKLAKAFYGAMFHDQSLWELEQPIERIAKFYKQAHVAGFKIVFVSLRGDENGAKKHIEGMLRKFDVLEDGDELVVKQGASQDLNFSSMNAGQVRENEKARAAIQHLSRYREKDGTNIFRPLVVAQFDNDPDQIHDGMDLFQAMIERDPHGIVSPNVHSVFVIGDQPPNKGGLNLKKTVNGRPVFVYNPYADKIDTEVDPVQLNTYREAPFDRGWPFFDDAEAVQLGEQLYELVKEQRPDQPGLYRRCSPDFQKGKSTAVPQKTLTDLRRRQLERTFTPQMRSILHNIKNEAAQGKTPLILSDIDGTVTSAAEKVIEIILDFAHSYYQEHGGTPIARALAKEAIRAFKNKSVAPRPYWEVKSFLEQTGLAANYPELVEAGTDFFNKEFRNLERWDPHHAIQGVIDFYRVARSYGAQVVFLSLRGKDSDLRPDGTSMTEDMLVALEAMHEGDHLLLQDGVSSYLAEDDMMSGKADEIFKADLVAPLLRAVGDTASGIHAKWQDPVVVMFGDNDPKQLKYAGELFGRLRDEEGHDGFSQGYTNLWIQGDIPAGMSAELIQGSQYHEYNPYERGVGVHNS